jgi:hypothetical protein
MVPYLTVDSPADIRPKGEPRGSRGSIILRTAAVEYPFLHRHTYDGDASEFFGGFIDFGIAVFVSSCCRLWRRTLFDRVCFSQRSPLHQKCTQASCQTICEVLQNSNISRNLVIIRCGPAQLMSGLSQIICDLIKTDMIERNSRFRRQLTILDMFGRFFGICQRIEISYHAIHCIRVIIKQLDDIRFALVNTMRINSRQWMSHTLKLLAQAVLKKVDCVQTS